MSDQWPNERKVQEAASDDIDWDFDDQGKVLRAHKKPNPISLKKIAEDQSPPTVITPNLAATGEIHVASSNARNKELLTNLSHVCGMTDLNSNTPQNLSLWVKVMFFSPNQYAK